MHRQVLDFLPRRLLRLACAGCCSLVLLLNTEHSAAGSVVECKRKVDEAIGALYEGLRPKVNKQMLYGKCRSLNKGAGDTKIPLADIEKEVNRVVPKPIESPATGAFH